MNSRQKAKAYARRIASFDRDIAAMKKLITDIDIHHENYRPRHFVDLVQEEIGCGDPVDYITRKVIRVPEFYLRMTIDSYEFLRMHKNTAEEMLLEKLKMATRQTVAKMILAGVVRTDDSVPRPMPKEQRERIYR